MSSLWSRINPKKIVRAVEAVPDLQRRTREFREEQKATQRQLRAVGRQLEVMSTQLTAQQKMLDALPELQSRIRQYLAVPRYDERQAIRASQSSIDTPNIGRDMRRAVTDAPLLTDPFPHIFMPQLIPDALYGEMIASLPQRVFFEHLSPNRLQLRVPFDFVPAYTRKVWHQFLLPLVKSELVPALLDKFSAVLDERMSTSWPDLAAVREQGLEFNIFNSRLLLRRPGYEITPHRDPRWAFITCLIYLPKLTDVQVYGTQLYRVIHDQEAASGSPLWLDYGDCELVKSVPGSAQSALAFVNWSGAHAATIPSDAPAGTERYLYQVQIGPDPASRERLLAQISPERRAAWVSKTDY